MAVGSDSHPIDARLAAHGLVLPAPPRPVGRYKAVMRSNGLLFLSGQFPLIDGEMRFRGQIGCDLSPEDGRQAARLAALNVLAHIREITCGWTEFDALLRVEGYVSSAVGWYDQANVLDGASELFADILGDRAGHARTAIPSPQLPFEAAVELVVVAAVTEPESNRQGTT